MSDDAIEPPKDGSDNIIDLAGVRIQWGRTKTKYRERCEHKSMVYDQGERRVWCEDCSRTIDNFDALMVLVRHFSKMLAEAKSKIYKANEHFGKSARLRATKALDRIWSGRTMAVQCPHCKKGLLPDDFADGAAACWAKELEIAARSKQSSHETD